MLIKLSRCHVGTEIYGRGGNHAVIEYVGPRSRVHTCLDTEASWTDDDLVFVLAYDDGTSETGSGFRDSALSAWQPVSERPSVYDESTGPIDLKCTNPRCAGTRTIPGVPNDPSTEVPCPLCGQRMCSA